MIGLSDLPTVNALLNSLSMVLLTCGYLFIRRRRIVAHVVCMFAALVVSSLFLVSYVVYHFHKGSTSFTGEGWIRPVYFAILVPHIILAAAVLPLALITVYLAVRGRWSAHVRLARWTFPIWLYVSVTGVVIYLMLYQLEL
jgi:putative membrane protein